MKKIIIKILLRLLNKEYYKPLSKEEVDFLLTKLSNPEEFEKLPAFLSQCENQYKNQYLYSGEIMFKGCVLAFSSLREQILSKRSEKKKTNLTKEEEGGIMKTPY